MTLQPPSASYGREETTRQKVTIDVSGTFGSFVEFLGCRCVKPLNTGAY
jgi:hypothetical protein